MPSTTFQQETRLKFISTLAKLCAILAGVLMTFITMLTCISILGRELVGKPITGDFELSGVAAGAAVALFMPWCQYKKGNIIVDFFTSKASDATNAKLDRFGALLMSLMMGLVAWRTVFGGLNSFDSNSGTMILGFPEWITYGLMVPPLALTAVIALLQVFCPASVAEPSQGEAA
jgi:TRAP-type C4-dicarboxylate transport system permease small subunit